MEGNKVSQYMTDKILQSYCVTMAMLEDYCKQTADNTKEHPESIKRRIMMSSDKIKTNLIKEIAALK